MERRFLVSKIYQTDGGSIHFKSIARNNGSYVLELAKEHYGFALLEFIRVSFFGKFLRRLGIVARFEYLLAFLIRLDQFNSYVVPTDSFLFLLVVSKSNSPVLYSYDIPWTYYSKVEREYIKKHLRRVLPNFNKILCISYGMCELYAELGISNVEIINSFIKKKFNVVEIDGLRQKIPLYLGNVRFRKETEELIGAFNQDVIHYGGISSIQGMLNAGFKEDIGEFLQDSTHLYFGVCVFSFSEDDYDLARSSIPSKLLTYNDMGIPVVYYGPGISEGYKLVVENKLGLAFSSLQELKNFFKR